jgi:uncharacterized protein (DUF362 family)
MAATGAAALSVPLVGACGSEDTGSEGIDGTAPVSADSLPGAAGRGVAGSGTAGNGDDEVAQVCGGQSCVAVSKHADILQNVRTAIEIAGGLGEIKGGDRVIIKPNMVLRREGANTNSEVLRGVIQAVKAHTDGANITVSDVPAFGADSDMIATITRYNMICEEEGVTFLGWDKQPYVGFRDPDWRYIKEEKRIPEVLDPSAPQYDHFINVPVLKNHEDVPYSDCRISICLKNFVGILPYNGEGSRTTPGVFGIHDTFLGRQVAELGRIVPRITMNVVDATAAGIDNGPAGGPTPYGAQDGPLVTVDSGLILASRDRVACDCVGLATLRHLALQHGISPRYTEGSVFEDAQIKRAAELSLGTADAAQIEIIDSGADDIRDIRDQLV